MRNKKEEQLFSIMFGVCIGIVLTVAIQIVQFSVYFIEKHSQYQEHCIKYTSFNMSKVGRLKEENNKICTYINKGEK